MMENPIWGEGKGVEFPGSPPGARQQANLQGICYKADLGEVSPMGFKALFIWSPEASAPALLCP